MQYSIDNNFSQNQKNVPEGLRVKERTGCFTRMENETRRMETTGEHSKGLEENKQTLNERWKDGEYRIVLEKLDLTEGWKEETMYIKESLVAWMAENEISTLIEESEDILDGLETMLAEEGSGVTEEVLIDAT